MFSDDDLFLNINFSEILKKEYTSMSKLNPIKDAFKKHQEHIDAAVQYTLDKLNDVSTMKVGDKVRIKATKEIVKIVEEDKDNSIWFHSFICDDKKTYTEIQLEVVEDLKSFKSCTCGAESAFGKKEGTYKHAKYCADYRSGYEDFE